MTRYQYELNKWCEVAVSDIKYSPDRKKVQAELFDHATDHYEALASRGLTEDEALQITLDAMGSAEELAPDLAAIHPPFWGYALRTCKILLIVLLILGLIPIWNYVKDLSFQDKPSLQEFSVYDRASYGGDTGRKLHHLSHPDLSFSSDGSTFTLTDAAVYTEYSDYYGEDITRLYVLIRQTSLLPRTEHDGHFRSSFLNITNWFFARDSLGNVYEGYHGQYNTDKDLMYSVGVQSSIFTSTQECWINGFPAEAEWVEICYGRDGRDFSLRVYLTGGEGA